MNTANETRMRFAWEDVADPYLVEVEEDKDECLDYLRGEQVEESESVKIELKIIKTGLVIKSLKGLELFQNSELSNGAQVTGIISHNGVQHKIYSLHEATQIISSFNIAFDFEEKDLSEAVNQSRDVDLEDSSEEIKEIVLNAIAEIEDISDKTKINIFSKDKTGEYLANNNLYSISYVRGRLSILNITGYIDDTSDKSKDGYSADIKLSEEQRKGMSFSLGELVSIDFKSSNGKTINSIDELYKFKKKQNFAYQTDISGYITVKNYPAIFAEDGRKIDMILEAIASAFLKSEQKHMSRYTPKTKAYE